MLGNSTSTSIVNLPLASEREAAYAAYVDDKLVRLLVVNMNAYNGSSSSPFNSTSRPVQAYTFRVADLKDNTKKEGKGVKREVALRRLVAGGSDAVSGVTFDGYSYNWELDEGMPVLLRNVTRGEKVLVSDDGSVTVRVPWSSAVIIDF